MQLWIQHKKLQRNGGKRLDLLVLAMGNLEVQCMNLGLFLEMMDMDFNQFLGGGNRTNSILLFVAWKNGRELSIHMNKKWRLRHAISQLEC